jgi:hypothetical protein
MVKISTAINRSAAMNMKIISGLAGLMVGVITTLIILYFAAPSILFIERESRLGYSETIAAIHEAAKIEGCLGNRVMQTRPCLQNP